MISPVLTYCSNVHPAETWAEVANMLAHEVTAVANVAGREGSFPVGLRLSAAAARELATPRAFDELQALLAEHAFEVCTINGFPFGEFATAPVKAAVYEPSWADPARVAYTLDLARLLVRILPTHASYGSVSTVPIGFRLGTHAQDRAAAHLVDVAVSLMQLEVATGRRIVVALEPEPMCTMATAVDVERWFARYLWTDAATVAGAARHGLAPPQVRDAVHRHLGVCFDVCHAAVEFDDPVAALDRFDAVGIVIGKIQLSCALTLTPDPESLATLAAFADDVYLHQVVVRGHDGGLARYLDLPDALDDATAAAAEQWRVHFHVPVFAESLGAVQTTQPELIAVLRHASQRADMHFEVETYSWPMLDPQFRGARLADDIARELAWVRARWTR